MTIPERVAILGGGAMGGAIATRLATLANGGETPLGPAVTVTTASRRAASELPDNVVRLDLETDADANRQAVAHADLVLLAVKPPLVPGLAAEIASALRPGTTVVSVAAGVTCASIEAALPAGTAVLRAIPNTPALIGLGITGLARGAAAGDDAAEAARWVFEQVGWVLEVPESRLDALTAVSGSGPAYLYLVIEAWTDAAVHRGFSPEEARRLVLGTVIGAAQLMETSGEDAATLRHRVTSPNGTTAAAMEVLAGGDLELLFDRALAAAQQRAAELARQVAEEQG